MNGSKTIADLFKNQPEQWGLRGDPYLWAEMASRLEDTTLPASREELENVIGEAFAELTGLPISHPKDIYVERYAHGGISSGQVCAEFWRETALPLLEKRRQACFEGSQP